MSAVLGDLIIASFLLVIYHHLIYPVLLGRLGPGRLEVLEVLPRRYRSRPSDIALPRVAIVIPAFNEASVISEKLRNLATLDYPAERLCVIIACDGCEDSTAALARATAAEPECRHLRVEVVEFPANRGKIATLNDTVAAVRAELVALSDASALVSVDALIIAARHFANPKVGVVCATYRLLEAGSVGEALYWKYQTKLKEREAVLGAPLGAHGAFYMIRRRLFQPLPHDTINDDFVLPMSIVVNGYHAVYDRQMVAVEIEPSSLGQDYRRRLRIAAGNMQQVLRLCRLLRPRYRGIAFAFASGKALRAFAPFLLVVSLAGSLAQAVSSQAFAAVAAVQCLAYGLAAVRYVAPGSGWPRPIEAIYYFVSGHMAGLIGSTRYLLGLDSCGWSRVGPGHTPRTVSRAGVTARVPHQLGAVWCGPGLLHVPVGRVAARFGSSSGLWPRHALHVHPVVAIVKRTLDVLVASAGLMATAPLLPLIALAIRLDSKGPVFFRQLRIGESWPDRTQLFLIIKFRTMHMAADATTPAAWATSQNRRITRVGRFLRKTRIDELPQLINVLRGNMSLVGPRPEQPGIFGWLDSNIPYYSERTYGVKPGITGFAQVFLGYDHTIEDVRTKLNYDHAYAFVLSCPRTWLALELKIIMRTLFVMAQGSGC